MMDNSNSPLRLAPVAVGGVGGSGTRLVANIIAQTGCYLGDHLNNSMDNLWFTALLRRTEWFHDFPAEPEICEAIDLFKTVMTTGFDQDCEQAYAALLDHIETDLSMRDDRDVQMLTPTLASLRKAAGFKPDCYQRWGWKEPNTHILLPQLAKRIDGLKYIHVIRSGLDMAFSNNQNQMKNWGRFLLGPGYDDTSQPLPLRSLTYWLAANQRAVRLGQTLFKDRFLLLNYDQLCQAPQKVLPKLFVFLETDIGQAEALNMIAPKSIGRYQDHDLSIFHQADIKATQDLMALSQLY